ncbi:MAG: NAD-dependent epimerase/dehydratase family protein [Rhodanobacter sp.]|nr:MAG: NAD-dependent epimerase/dehydratase family protein [Rhodanobacter sp.]TAM01880.1 MAG: NAD-dependent epimerase/dehydratase family protein [Rhodanobacter sp.]TAM39854.1 MAG: NAD-dependent epimerase/dehydratase family protein [Rhodanobacter sp.]TAN23424.1 MAG: NAD-dependent epimerase/dehydratase family protein [Rhodanobacter sp.]
MTVLVVGGSSQIGHFLLPRLVAGGEPVMALSRIARPAGDGVQWLRGALPDAVPALPTLSAIISFGPLQALADWLAQATLADAPRVIATSSMSAETKRDSMVPAEREIARLLRAGEVALAAACARQGCAWTVLRPTLVYGAGLDKSLTPIARRALRTRLFPIPAGRGLRQPVHADDIAQAVLAALECPAAAGRVLSIGGGERLLYPQMFARVRRSLPRATVPVWLPAWLLRLGRRLYPPLRGPLSRLDRDLVADNDELQRLLHIQPRPFQPDAAMWVAPRRSP